MNGQDVVILRPPRFFCEDVLCSDSSDQSIAQTMVIELLGRRAALVDVITAHVKALARVNALRGKTYTLAAQWPFTREETSTDGYEVARMVQKRWGHRYKWKFPSVISRVYDSSAAREALEWTPLWDFERAVALLEKDDPIVVGGLF